ncbi:Nuclear fragile X mental retardation-interacting protein 1 [Abeliophyllum distichum]|uniref:Nuclear fragile X mental retardation-interacting protein 1 n=1 Tax=Abeliophyllum distichum TaxID=126358 RepID=A0ABD1PB00_9LAMI
MLPHFNSNPHHSNQLQSNGTTPSANQQVMANPGSFCPNPLQIQHQLQMGILNPGIPLPFANLHTGFAPNQLFPFPQGQLQNHNLNFIALNQMNNNNNSSQALGSILAQNAMNPPQFLSNGQLNLLNPMQNVNQLLQMQMQMQFPGCGPVVPQNPNLVANGQSGIVNGNEVVQQSMNGNSTLKHMPPNVNKQLHSNSPLGKTSGFPQPGWNQNSFSPGASKPQSNLGKFNGVNKNKNGWRKSHDKNFAGNPKFDASQRGYPNPQFHHKQNTKGNFKFNTETGRKGHENVNLTLSDSNKQIQVREKRTLSLNYTEQEIQQWREERRKNHPAKAKIENKLKEDQIGHEAADAVFKIRRQQLKEILAKQAELGCEVAEIPPCYLSDSEQQADGRGENKRAFNKRERFQNGFNKRGRFHQNDRFSKRQTPVNHDSANLHGQNNHFTKRQSGANDGPINQCMTNKREPSLLQKLLSSDIRRDKRHMLHVFRFMVMNSFFQEWPEKPLKFPVVIVKEPGDESKIAEGDYAQIVKNCNENADDSSKNEDVIGKNCR